MKKAQSIVEYIILIGIVSFALISMHTYAKRGIQVVAKLSADKLGEKFGGQEGNTGTSHPEWFDIWQPEEPISTLEVSSESAEEQAVNSSAGRVRDAQGRFRSSKIKSFSLEGRKIDKELE